MRISDWSSYVCSSDLALRHLLGMADFTTPFRFLETLLSGPIDGRRKLYARLGREARDPIDELLSQALAFETRETVSLLGFLTAVRSEEHTSELQSLMRISYAVFCLKKKTITTTSPYNYSNIAH